MANITQFTSRLADIKPFQGLRTSNALLDCVNSMFVPSPAGVMPAIPTWFESFYSSPAATIKLLPNATRNELRRTEAELEDAVAQFEKLIQQKDIEKEELQNKLVSVENALERNRRAESLAFLLQRISEDAWDTLQNQRELQDKFLKGKPCQSFVMSVDIRRSTELMLKAKTPELFASFLAGISGDLCETIKKYYGVLDKFTGDGVLAFFPKFFSGPDAGLRALLAAAECHARFERRYKDSRAAFSSVPLDIGLGIGIDYGATHLLKVVDGLTVVGIPVVYACRFGGAPANCTYLNQPAYEELENTDRNKIRFDEERLTIKHEGDVLAYRAVTLDSRIELEEPEWKVAASNSAEPSSELEKEPTKASE